MPPGCTGPAPSTSSRSLVAASDRVRALGSGHSFSPVADTTGDLVSVAGLPATVDVSPDRTTATVAAGMRYGEVAVALQAHGLALHNLGSLPHISVAGAVATGTHGSGPTLGSLSTAVVGLDLVTARRERCCGWTAPTRGSPARSSRWVPSVSSPRVTLAVQPTYDVAQTVYEDLPVRRLADRPRRDPRRRLQRQPVHRLGRGTSSTRSGSSDGPTTGARARTRPGWTPGRRPSRCTR